MDSYQEQTFSTFNGDVGSTAGYAGLAMTSDANIAQTASKYLNDSLLLNELTEQVYKILQEDLRSQRERTGDYSSHRWL
ncbi:hypothetical protein [Nostoc sp. PA-18-2419]|uniref:hypothetical protein n=1 Tax=Nostoc sp. PA-18-2419 TaxID=2575443 RepID=UPI001109FC42|nr:hypothetical protein [Nostoc sp. PA-18-2419]